MFSLTNVNWKHYIHTAINSPHYWLAYNLLNGGAFRPLNVDWELTFRCNLSCQMCPQELYKSQSGAPRSATSDEELSLDEMKKVVDDLAEMGVEVITLTGGEPFLHPDATELVDYIKQNDLACNILTNGGVMTEDIARQIVQAGVDALTFSMDGPREVHDETRGRKGCFDKLCNAVNLVQDIKKAEKRKAPSLAFNCTISSLNQNCFSEILEVANKLKVPTVNFAYLFFSTQEAVDETGEIIEMQGVKEENQVLPEYLKTIDPALIEKQLTLCREQADKYGVIINILPPLQSEEITRYFNDDSYAYCSKCFFPWYASRINPYGAVYPCSIDYCIGNVRRQPFSELWNSQAYCDFRKKLKKIGIFPKCRKCCMLNNKLWSVLPSI